MKIADPRLVVSHLIEPKATAFMCLILGSSVYWMRRKHYELFLILHIIISILVLITIIL